MVRRALQAAALIFAGSFISANCNPPACDAPTCPSGQYLMAGKCVLPLAPGSTCNRTKDICAAVDGVAYACVNETCAKGQTFGGQCLIQNCGYAFSAGEPTFCTCGARCGTYVHAARSCDSNAESPGCMPCLPGLSCVGGKCIQACVTDQDCPCSSSGTPLYSCRTAPGSQSSAARCVTCRSLGESCDKEVNPCCRSGESCGSSNTCCRNPGAACSSRSDCCDASASACIGGTCQACHKAGNSCNADGDCCSGMTCKSGVCSVPCTLNATCTTGKLGVCKNGHIVECLPTGGACGQDTPASPEACDGLDNDCNGLTDDGIASTACTGATVSGCQSGFTLAGTTKCAGGKTVCEARACDTSDANDKDCYCTMCGAATGGNGGPCGECAATGPCIPGVILCIPSSVCSSAGGSPPAPPTCHADTIKCNVFPRCWTPADLKPPPDHCYGG